MIVLHESSLNCCPIRNKKTVGHSLESFFLGVADFDIAFFKKTAVCDFGVETWGKGFFILFTYIYCTMYIVLVSSNNFLILRVP